MAIKRYTAKKDTTITNAFTFNLITRGTGSNMGASDSLEVFSIFGQEHSSSIEKSRILLKFATDEISTDRAAGNVPASGSVNFYLRLYNAEHPLTLPYDFTLAIHAVSRSWDEGRGLDMDEYTDNDYANWISAASASGVAGITDWTTEGGDFHTGSYVVGTLPIYSHHFSEGTEDLELNITDLVEEWINVATGTVDQPNGDPALNNHGIAIMMTSSQEDGSQSRSYYTKKFFARSSEFFYKRPAIEARWDSSNKDDSGNFYLSSSLADAADNLNNLYLYNFVRGQLKNIPAVGTKKLLLSVHSASGQDALSLPPGGGVRRDGDTFITASYVCSGTYSASFAYASSSITKLYPVWYTGSSHAPASLPTDTVQYHTGSAITVKTLAAGNFNPNPRYVTSITNFKSSYANSEEARFRLHIRQKDWGPTIYTKATSDIENEIIEDAYYKVIRIVDRFEAVPYGTGSLNYTRMSYDASGSYFDLDVSLLEAGYAYGIKFVYYINGAYHEQSETFKFRVE